MLTIYHNPRCSKSREALQFLIDKNLEHQIVNYTEEPLTPDEIYDLLDLLEMDAFELIRTKEQVWKEEFAELEMDDDELVLLMIEYPGLMERPIVASEDAAVLAIPPDKINQLL